MKLSFYFKKSQGLNKAKLGYGSIFLYVNLKPTNSPEKQTKSFEKTTKVRCHRSEWNSASSLIEGDKPDVSSRNLMLQRIKSNFESFVDRNPELTYNDLEEYFEALHEVKGVKIIRKFEDVFQEFLLENKSRIRKEGRPRTIATIEQTTYHTYLKRWDNIYDFLKKTNKTKILCSQIDELFFYSFEKWMLESFGQTGKKRGQDYTTKHLTLLRASLTYAVMKKYIPCDLAAKYRFSHDPLKDVITVDEDVFEKLYSFEHFSETQKKYMHAFVFMRELMINYTDYMTLKESETYFDKNDNLWLRKRRAKSLTEETQIIDIPFTQRANEIIEIYGGIEKLPKATNPVMNFYIKNACMKAGIEDHVSTKKARSAGITYMHNCTDIKPLEMCSFLGWETDKESKRYIMLDKQKMWNKFMNKSAA